MSAQPALKTLSLIDPAAAAAADIRAFLEAGYEEMHCLYVVLAVAVKTLSIYTNHAFDTPLDASFASYRV